MKSVMPALRGALSCAAGLVLAGCSNAGFGGASTPDHVPAAFVVDEALAPSLVIATRPTMSEILDLVLRERPTAADLAGGAGAARLDRPCLSACFSQRTHGSTRVQRALSEPGGSCR